MQLQDRAWDNVDVEFFGELAVFGQVGLPMAAGIFETWVFGYPVEEMVLWEHGETGALFGDGADVADGFFVICFELHGLCCGVLAKACRDDHIQVAQVTIPLGAFVSRLPCELVP